jgi:hypothetical protein
MRTLNARLMAVAMLACAPSALRAQADPVELGIDAALAVTIDDPRVATLGVPVQQFRVGFHNSPTLSIEPTLAMNYINVEGFGDVSTISLGVGLLFHTSPNRARGRAYFRPFGGFTKVSDGGDTSPNVGIGVGYTAPFADRRLATRLEGLLRHTFVDGDDTTSIGVMFGLSFFTR